MKKFFLQLLFIVVCSNAFGMADSVVIPIQRKLIHERINEEQVKCDKADGKVDGTIKVSGNEEINLQVTDAVIRKINELQNYIESDPKVATNNEKIRQLNFIFQVVKDFRTEWMTKRLNPVWAPMLIDNFEKILVANIDSINMAPFINEVPYEIGKINTEIFKNNNPFKRQFI